MKSPTCKGPNGKFLEEYHSRSAADLAAEDIKLNFGYELYPSLCRSCGYWHLAPVNTRKQCFHCTDSALFLKDLYASKNEALSSAEWVRKEKKIQLYPYKCPHSNGWHLTKAAPGKKSGK